jgi:hypothetical protein
MPATTLAIQGDQLVNLALDNQQIPSEGTKAIPMLLDFTLANQFTLDLTNIQQRGFLSMVQSLYIDNSTSDIPLQIFINGSQMVVVAKGRTQGWYTVMCPNPVKFAFSCPGGPGFDVTTGRYGIRVYFCNVPIPGVVWPTA